MYAAMTIFHCYHDHLATRPELAQAENPPQKSIITGSSSLLTVLAHSSDAHFALLMLEYPKRHDTFANIWWGYTKRPLTRYVCLDRTPVRDSWWQRTVPDALTKAWHRDRPNVRDDIKLDEIDIGYPTAQQGGPQRRVMSITLNDTELAFQAYRYYGPFTQCPLHIGLSCPSLLGYTGMHELRKAVTQWVDMKVTALGLAYIANMGAI